MLTKIKEEMHKVFRGLLGLLLVEIDGNILRIYQDIPKIFFLFILIFERQVCVHFRTESLFGSICAKLRENISAVFNSLADELIHFSDHSKDSPL